jgi:hypothetical protein
MKVIPLILAALCGLASAQTVTPSPVQGAYAEFVVTLPNGGNVPMSSAQVDYTKFWAVSGSCVKTTIRRPPRNALVTTGVQCYGASSFHLALNGLGGGSYCPGDGELLQAPRLTLAADNVIFYSEPTYDLPDQVCYVTPAALPTVTFTYPVLTVDNSTQARPSASFTYYLDGYLFSNYTFTSDTQGVVCDRWLKDMDPSPYVIRLQEVGTKCVGIVPANSIAHVVIQ